jgi:hypothetical protein
MYLFFEPALDNPRRSLEDALRSIYGLSVQAIPSYFCDNSFCSRKPIKSFNLIELIKYCWIHQLDKPALLVTLPIELESDAALIQQFGDAYLGCISGSIKKSELQNLALSYRKLVQTEGSRRFFSVPSFVVEERLKQTPFTEAEIKILIKLQDKNLKLVDQFIQKKVDQLKRELSSLPSILTRGIGARV